MPTAFVVLAALVNWLDTPAVPGQCSQPAAEHVGEPGCFLTGELRLAPREGPLWWHLTEFPSLEAARAAAAGQPQALAAASHGRFWLHVLAGATPPVTGGTLRATVGPLQAPAGVPLAARFIESVFTPGMRTRIHRHPGPEAFYVVEGQQCMETPDARRKLEAGDTFIVPPVLHVQAAPKGRRNIALLLQKEGEAWMVVESGGWAPSQFCAD